MYFIFYFRKLDSGLAEFQCTLQLPKELVNEAITYRYVICDGSTDSSVDVSDIPFEFLSHEEQPACRCMIIEGFCSKGILYLWRGKWQAGGEVLRQIEVDLELLLKPPFPPIFRPLSGSFIVPISRVGLKTNHCCPFFGSYNSEQVHL